MRLFRFCLLAACVLPVSLGILAPVALAQMSEEEDHYSAHIVELNTITAPLIVPTIEDFAPADGESVASAPSGSPDKSLLSNSGISTYFEVTSKQKAGLLTPYYKYSRTLNFKARIPLIYNRTLSYTGHDATASGIGDITLESEYKRYMARFNGIVGLQLSLKMPTGNDTPDADDDGYTKPALGTGSWDIISRGSYARSTPVSGLVATVLFRKNSSAETVTEAADWIYTSTVTNASQTVASTFYRRMLSQKIWWNLGVSFTKLGNGSRTDNSHQISTGTDYPNSGDATQGGTLMDLYPGISYKMGAFNPFIGIRVPLLTDMDSGDLDRDMAVIVQFSYRPGRMAGSE